MHGFFGEEPPVVRLAHIRQHEPAELFGIDQLLRELAEERLPFARMAVVVKPADELGSPGIDRLIQRDLSVVGPAPDQIAVHLFQIRFGVFLRGVAESGMFFMQISEEPVEHWPVALFEPDGTVVERMSVRTVIA